jgi:hypothetical protein
VEFGWRLAALRGRQQSFCLRHFLGFDPVLGFDRFDFLLLILLLLVFDAQDAIENGDRVVLLAVRPHVCPAPRTDQHSAVLGTVAYLSLSSGTMRDAICVR